MRRNTSLAVNVNNNNNNNDDLQYDLHISPRTSIDSTRSDDIKQSRLSLPTSITQLSPPPPPPQPIAPSIRLLFSLLSRRQVLCLLVPALFTSMVTGGIAPFMTYVVGQAFDAFAQFPLTPNPPQEAKDQLLRSMAISALELVGLAVGALALSSLTSCLWIWTGENNVMTLRKKVYAAVTQKDMVWFDTKLGAEGTVQSAEGEQGPLGAGGLMAKFTRETDDVRMASSLASGMLVQYITTCISCLILAFMRSWQLTLVILSAVPALILIQGFSQSIAGPRAVKERKEAGTAATLVDRAVSSIATVKAFNATAHEETAVNAVFDRLRWATRRLSNVWFVCAGFAQFTTMSMFVQGFWFGAKLVKEGKVGPGDVMAVFWACLIATSNLQMCIPHFITLATGKFAMVSLLTLIRSESPSQAAPSSPSSPAKSASPTTPSSILSPAPTKSAFKRASKGGSVALRKIVPNRCAGELALHDVTFAYPSRPTMPVLQDVSLYLPARETTFIVGSSGSGKSTVAQLLLRMYTPQRGVVQLDDQDVRFLDETWIKEHVAGVAQGTVLFDRSVHDNVAMGLAGSGGGRTPDDATRDEVVEACRAAMMHEFIRDLPDGYETMLGTGGAALSGGQRQRLAIARAKLRNPDVLILDEATSALDGTSRILVFEAIKRWRANKTTVVITHDLSQVSPSDFVYVLKSGRVVEQGYRYDLENAPSGEFREMMDSQRATGGFLPEKNLDNNESSAVERILEQEDRQRESEEDAGEVTAAAPPFNMSIKHQSMLARNPSLRPLTLGNWMFDVVADLTNNKPTTAPIQPAVLAGSQPYRISRFVPPEAFIAEETTTRARRPSSICISALPSPTAAHTVISRRYSLQFTPTSPTFSINTSNSTVVGPYHYEKDAEEEAFDQEKLVIRQNGEMASRRRQLSGGLQRPPRTRWDAAKVPQMTSVKSSSKTSLPKESKAGAESNPDNIRPSLYSIFREVYPAIPMKPLFFLGIFVCLCSGAMTPIFSFLLSRLLFEVSTGAKDTNLINIYGGIVLAVAALDATFIALKYFILDTNAMAWVTKIRKGAFSMVMKQDKKWFDKSENGAARIVQSIVKDGDDARHLISVVVGQFFVVMSMMSVGLIWAMVRGWQLTLVGLAIGPVFAVTMAVQTNLVAKCEARNKRAREEVAKGYYETITNIRGIRCMAFESVFQTQFNEAADRALSTGVRGAFVEGCTLGVASGLIYLAEALLFYVGAVLIARGTYTYLQMVEVLNLVVFTVSIGSQLMAFTQKIAKSSQATSDINQFLKLSTDTDESRGFLRPPISGNVSFSNVQFTYPERPDAPVLRNVNFEIQDGECVAIVGASGSGKSTIAALIQRLYEPTGGSIYVGLNALNSTNVGHLRDHVSVVSQHPNLFDASIAENIRYGNPAASDEDVRSAGKAANVHDFIMTLPHGYDTLVGENASLISGGQAQRLQIARALARPSNLLILDECTSALDGANQQAVLDTISKAKEGRTTIMVTHKVPAMRMCDRVLVVENGEIVEDGSYDELMARKGVFATLAGGGEWMKD